ncbi:sugar phosphate nucleotidyltransferase [Tuberibacillus sp. Marseille-P3662]|uniref:sugar phosphate nucleotidyltransferase n=1 Tax=Tuberibacillus sp. Marseille-P3662 TaxID=1965358 RepID=UPI000A1CE4BD|nr:sugar phosphate nucleotidyltransferase [Tuberibacillus sp. Marseille-P3662]
MKGVILAGGAGTRLRPVTKVINKHLLPVGRYPMIVWPIFKLKEAGISDLFIVTNQHDLDLFQRLLGDGHEWGVNLQYGIQQQPDGIAAALYQAKYFAADESVVVHLGDNIYRQSLAPFVSQFLERKKGAHVLLKHVPDPERFGVAIVNKTNQTITAIHEKPKQPLSHYCVTGIYMFDRTVFDRIESIDPSGRGELEITDVNNQYIEEGDLTYDVFNDWWIDAGTHETLYQANVCVHE